MIKFISSVNILLQVIDIVHVHLLHWIVPFIFKTLKTIIKKSTLLQGILIATNCCINIPTYKVRVKINTYHMPSFNLPLTPTIT